MVYEHACDLWCVYDMIQSLFKPCTRYWLFYKSWSCYFRECLLACVFTTRLELRSLLHLLPVTKQNHFQKENLSFKVKKIMFSKIVCSNRLYSIIDYPSLFLNNRLYHRIDCVNLCSQNRLFPIIDYDCLDFQNRLCHFNRLCEAVFQKLRFPLYICSDTNTTSSDDT